MWYGLTNWKSWDDVPKCVRIMTYICLALTVLYILAS